MQSNNIFKEIKMKFKKIISVVLIVVSVLLTATSCQLISNIFHKHTWQDFLAKEPTCTEVGLLKKVCLECGETEYSEINMSNHVFRDDVCIYCGGTKDALVRITKVVLPSGLNNDGMWSMDKVYQTACDVSFGGSYESFVNSLSKGSLKNASIDSVGMLHITALFYLRSGKISEAPLMLAYEAVSPLNPTSSVGTIWSAYVKGGNLILTYANGKEIQAGSFDSSENSYIIGFGINTAKELVVYYSDNTIGFGGKIAN